MRLADFIEREMQAILSRWEEFAATLLPAARGLDSLALRDHGEEILRAVAADLRTPQTRDEQREKSRGLALAPSSETAAQTHALLRASAGFSIRQLVSEYRALRASVLRQYHDVEGHGATELEDVGRFNEAIDQAVAESVDFFTTEVERWRSIFLGVLAHDLRGPLNSIRLMTDLLAQKNPSPELGAHFDRLVRSEQRMFELLDALFDFNRFSLGGQFAVEPKTMDLVETCRHEIELQRSAHPSACIELEAPASCLGIWDASRIRQALANLIGNAVRYGSETPILVAVQRVGEHVRVEVENTGATLPPAELVSIFDPLFRGSAGTSHTARGHLGLGLFIVRQIAVAHGGRVEARSADGVTAFSMLLPGDATVAIAGAPPSASARASNAASARPAAAEARAAPASAGRP